MKVRLRRGLLLAACALVPSASALGAATPLTIAPAGSGPPAIAVDGAGTAYVAWPDGATVGYCVLPTGATSCQSAGTLTPAGGVSAVTSVVLLDSDGTITVLAGVSGPNSADQPLQEWRADDGTTNFTIVGGGASVADGPVAPGTVPTGAAVLPGPDGDLGVGWGTTGGGGAFSVVPSGATPGACPEATGCPFATLLAPGAAPGVAAAGAARFATDADQAEFAGASGVTGISGVTGATGTTGPAVAAVVATDTGSGPFACPTTEYIPLPGSHGYPVEVSVFPIGLGLLEGHGAESPASDYGVAPGTSGSGWALGYELCGATDPALADGPGGIHLLSSGGLQPDSLPAITEGLIDGPDTSITYGAGLEPSLGFDASGGAYATYLGSGTYDTDGKLLTGMPIVLAYQQSARARWLTEPLDPNTDGHAAGLASAVGPAGQGWATWTDLGALRAVPFTAADALPPQVPPTLDLSQLWVYERGSVEPTHLQIPYGARGESFSAGVMGPPYTSGPLAGGTVTDRLYRGVTCTRSRLVFESGSLAVDPVGGQVPSSPPVRLVLAPGTYEWQASYSGAPSTLAGGLGLLPAVSRCGASPLVVGTAAAFASTGRLSPDGGALVIHGGCRGELTRCRATVTVLPADAGSRRTPLGGGAVTLSWNGSRGSFATIPLSAAGRALVARTRGVVAVRLVVRERMRGRLVTQARSVSIRIGTHR